MQREVTKTTVKAAIMKVVDGSPVAEPIEDINLLGNVSLEKAQKEVNKLHKGATVFNVEVDTQIYEMPVEEFIQLATIKEEVPAEAEQA